MDYKFTFEDGSASLMHYGKKGMKWGIWNAETMARYKGGTSKEAKKYAKGYEKYQKLKGKAEEAADRYTANPTRLNKARLNRAVDNETLHNSKAYQKSISRTKTAQAIGGLPAAAVYNAVSKKQKRDTSLAKAHYNETMSARLDDAAIRYKKATGKKAVSEVLNKSTQAKANAAIENKKAKAYSSQIKESSKK